VKNICENRRWVGQRNWVGGCEWGCGENSNELMCCVEERELNV